MTPTVRRLRTVLHCAIVALLAFAVHGAFASDFVVSPLLVTLGTNAKSSQIVVRNEGEDEIRFELHLRAWRQDDAGADHYEDSDDLVFFPRTMSIQGGQSRTVRVGLKGQTSEIERAYRLYIEELPPASRPNGANAQLQVLLNVGVPVFVEPTAPMPRIEIAAFAIDNGNATFAVRNGGNEHFKLTRMRIAGHAADGAERFAQDIDDRYFLAGTRKAFSIAIPREACRQLTDLELLLVTDQSTVSRKLDVAPSACQ